MSFGNSAGWLRVRCGSHEQATIHGDLRRVYLLGVTHFPFGLVQSVTPACTAKWGVLNIPNLDCPPAPFHVVHGLDHLARSASLI